ncbi:glyoxalase [Sphingobacterium sp. N143]|nr:glyoxalase [Sphingobacterium sp. N143]
MLVEQRERLQSGIFITFTGNCRAALTFYQTCFGGTLHFEMLDQAIQGYAAIPVVSASLISERIVLHGSDLVHNEGRRVGNYLAIYLPCRDSIERASFIDKLVSQKSAVKVSPDEQAKFIEVTDIFDVRWVLGI